MSTILSTTYPTAKKDYRCDACHWLLEGGLPQMPYSDAKKYVLAKNDGFKIKKGMKYIKVAQIFDGDFCAFRARIEIDELCHKYDVYESD